MGWLPGLNEIICLALNMLLTVPSMWCVLRKGCGCGWCHWASAPRGVQEMTRLLICRSLKLSWSDQTPTSQKMAKTSCRKWLILIVGATEGLRAIAHSMWLDWSEKLPEKMETQQMGHKRKHHLSLYYRLGASRLPSRGVWLIPMLPTRDLRLRKVKPDS